MTLAESNQNSVPAGYGSELPGNLGFLAPASFEDQPENGVFTRSFLDKEALESSPINPDWILEGSPQAKCKNLSRIGNYWTTVDHWSCTAGKFRWHYDLDETILILEGKALITDDQGAEYHADPGTTLTFPYGSSATWVVPNYVRKIAFNQRSVPTYLHRACNLLNRVQRKFFR
ncbi:cupin domain-containing protein [Roseibium sp.]|uniref:cupin domain-containing protein n=1 Tax=Roseibium sp. TaxID=1936156 RepID=UPI002607569A|nr:cupin domain-containing protein [Roseibium sp.]